MDRETVAFLGPLVGLLVGMAIMLVGIFQGGLTTLTFVGIFVGLASIIWLGTSVARVDHGHSPRPIAEEE